jgi:hypothetical protein
VSAKTVPATNTPLLPAAPLAPGTLDSPPDPPAILKYLEQLVTWRRAVRDAFEDLDRRAQAVTNPESHTPSITLGWTLWQAISDRTDAINAQWDSGRVTNVECARIGQLIWGRLDNTSGGLAVSLTEASQLVEALAGQLHARLETDALGRLGVGDRVGALRDQLDRLAESGILIAELDALRVQFDSALIAARSANATGNATGTDQADVLASLTRQLATIERDTIVAQAHKHSVERDGVTLHAALDELRSTAGEVAELETRCRSKIAGVTPMSLPTVNDVREPAPPSGPVDAARWLAARVAFDALSDRVTQLREAFDAARRHYQDPLDRRSELRGLLSSYHAMAADAGLIEDPAAMASHGAAKTVLYGAPCDLTRATSLVNQYVELVRSTREVHG